MAVITGAENIARYLATNPQLPSQLVSSGLTPYLSGTLARQAQTPSKGNLLANFGKAMVDPFARLGTSGIIGLLDLMGEDAMAQQVKRNAFGADANVAEQALKGAIGVGSYFVPGVGPAGSLLNIGTRGIAGGVLGSLSTQDFLTEGIDAGQLAMGGALGGAFGTGTTLAGRGLGKVIGKVAPKVKGMLGYGGVADDLSRGRVSAGGRSAMLPMSGYAEVPGGLVFSENMDEVLRNQIGGLSVEDLMNVTNRLPVEGSSDDLVRPLLAAGYDDPGQMLTQLRAQEIVDSATGMPADITRKLKETIGTPLMAADEVGSRMNIADAQRLIDDLKYPGGKVTGSQLADIANRQGSMLDNEALRAIRGNRTFPGTTRIIPDDAAFAMDDIRNALGDRFYPSQLDDMFGRPTMRQASASSPALPLSDSTAFRGGKGVFSRLNGQNLMQTTNPERARLALERFADELTPQQFASVDDFLATSSFLGEDMVIDDLLVAADQAGVPDRVAVDMVDELLGFGKRGGMSRAGVQRLDPILLRESIGDDRLGQRLFREIMDDGAPRKYEKLSVSDVRDAASRIGLGEEKVAQVLDDYSQVRGLANDFRADYRIGADPGVRFPRSASASAPELPLGDSKNVFGLTYDQAKRQLQGYGNLTDDEIEKTLRAMFGETTDTIGQASASAPNTPLNDGGMSDDFMSRLTNQKLQSQPNQINAFYDSLPSGATYDDVIRQLDKFDLDDESAERILRSFFEDPNFNARSSGFYPSASASSPGTPLRDSFAGRVADDPFYAQLDEFTGVNQQARELGSDFIEDVDYVRQMSKSAADRGIKLEYSDMAETYEYALDGIDDINRAAKEAKNIMQLSGADVLVDEEGAVRMFAGVSDDQYRALSRGVLDEPLRLVPEPDDYVGGVGGASYDGNNIVEVWVDPRKLTVRAEGEAFLSSADGIIETNRFQATGSGAFRTGSANVPGRSELSTWGRSELEEFAIQNDLVPIDEIGAWGDSELVQIIEDSADTPFASASASDPGLPLSDSIARIGDDQQGLLGRAKGRIGTAGRDLRITALRRKVGTAPPSFGGGLSKNTLAEAVVSKADDMGVRIGDADDLAKFGDDLMGMHKGEIARQAEAAYQAGKTLNLGDDLVELLNDLDKAPLDEQRSIQRAIENVVYKVTNKKPVRGESAMSYVSRNLDTLNQTHPLTGYALKQMAGSKGKFSNAILDRMSTPGSKEVYNKMYAKLSDKLEDLVPELRTINADIELGLKAKQWAAKGLESNVTETILNDPLQDALFFGATITGGAPGGIGAYAFNRYVNSPTGLDQIGRGLENLGAGNLPDLGVTSGREMSRLASIAPQAIATGTGASIGGRLTLDGAPTTDESALPSPLGLSPGVAMAQSGLGSTGGALTSQGVPGGSQAMGSPVGSTDIGALGVPGLGGQPSPQFTTLDIFDAVYADTGDINTAIALTEWLAPQLGLATPTGGILGMDPGEAEQMDKNQINALSGLEALDTIEALSGNFAAMAASNLPFSGFSKEAQLYKTARDMAADVIARLRTGAAINDIEAELYWSMVPGATDVPEVRAYKINALRNLFASVAQGNYTPTAGVGDMYVEEGMQF